MVDGIVVAMVSDTWEDSVRRGFYSTADQFILSVLAAEDAPQVLVVDHPRGVASQFKRRARGERAAPSTPYLSGLRPWALRTSLPNAEVGVERRYRLYDRQVRLAMKARRMRDPVLVTFNVWHAAYGDHSSYRAVYLYVQDDEREIPRHKPISDRLDAAYARASERSTVVAVSGVLARRISPTGHRIVVPNGIDPQLWSRASGVVRLRTAVYAGTIDSRIDLVAVRSLIDAGFAVIMAGPTPEQDVRSALVDMGVQLLGRLDRESVVELVATAGVCFLAHRTNNLTNAMSPLKLYEYLCGGRPVVGTRLTAIEEDPSLAEQVVLVDRSEDFGSHSQRALTEWTGGEAQRQSNVRRFSWRARHQPLIEELLGR